MVISSTHSNVWLRLLPSRAFELRQLSAEKSVDENATTAAGSEWLKQWHGAHEWRLFRERWTKHSWYTIVSGTNEARSSVRVGDAGRVCLVRQLVSALRSMRHWARDRVKMLRRLLPRLMRRRSVSSLSAHRVGVHRTASLLRWFARASLNLTSGWSGSWRTGKYYSVAASFLVLIIMAPENK